MKTFPVNSLLVFSVITPGPLNSIHKWSLGLHSITLGTDIGCPFVAGTGSGGWDTTIATLSVYFVRILACASGVSLTLAPYFHLSSMDKLSAYLTLAVPLAVAVAVLVNWWARTGADEVDDDDVLDRVFDVSWAVTNVVASGGLTISSKVGRPTGLQHVRLLQPGVVATDPLGFLPFLTICLGAYLMLVALVRRPKALIRDTERLVYVHLFLLVVTTLVAVSELVGWVTCFMIAKKITEVVLSTALQAKVRIEVGTAAREVNASDRKNEPGLAWIVVSAALFMIVYFAASPLS